MSPKTFMTRALALARRGRSGVGANPMVGCVLVKGGKIVGEGWHRRIGGAHAEAGALSRAGAKARGATAFVTLEPCSAHPGKKTPPCAPALIAAGVSKVVAATLDPNPQVSGRGLGQLRRAGLRTQVGLLGAESRALNADFTRRMALRRPYVILKSALSLDGRAYAAGGESKWITGPAARKFSRALRSKADAILVGVNTVLKDDPSLTAGGGGKNPLRVVLDTRLRTPKNARVADGAAPTVIFTASARRHPRAETVRVPRAAGKIPLAPVLENLVRRGVRSLIVEGGPSVHASFLAAGAVDEARVFIAPKLISGARTPGSAPRIRSPRLRRIGEDFLFTGKVECSRE